MNESRTSLAPRRSVAIGIALTMLAVPALYVVLHRSPADAVLASAAAAPPPPAVAQGEYDLAQLEHLAMSDPTEGHQLNLSQAYLNKGMTGRAIIVLNNLVAQYPKDALAWNNLCVAHTLQQEYYLAIPNCMTGIRADPNTQLIKNNLNWAEQEKAKVVAALDAETKVPVEERKPESYITEGLNHLHLGEFDQAVASWKKCLELDPKSAPAQNNIGIAYMLQSRYTEAETNFRQALVLDPKFQLAKNNLAWALEEEKTSPGR